MPARPIESTTIGVRVGFGVGSGVESDIGVEVGGNIGNGAIELSSSVTLGARVRMGVG